MRDITEGILPEEVAFLKSFAALSAETTPEDISHIAELLREAIDARILHDTLKKFSMGITIHLEEE